MTNWEKMALLNWSTSDKCYTATYFVKKKSDFSFLLLLLSRTCFPQVCPPILLNGSQSSRMKMENGGQRVEAKDVLKETTHRQPIPKSFI